MADNQPAAPVYTPSGESPQLGAIISELLSEVASTDQLGDAPVRLAEMLDQLLGEPRARELLQCTLEHKNPASVLKRPADNFTEVSAFADDQAEATNQLQMIKARTMYNMVEEIDEGMCKLLFLTNAQADLIAKSPGSVQKMLDALEVGKPSLVIELCCSPGFRDAVRTLPLDPQACADSGWQGFIPDRPPFLDRTEERDAEAKIDMFMANVLIPLAAQTNAIVLCSATADHCILSKSFLRMYGVARPKWGNKKPFTVISTTNDIDEFYLNPDLSTRWRETTFRIKINLMGAHSMHFEPP